MKTKQTSQLLALLAVAALVIAFIFTQTSIVQMIAASPWWMYLVVVGILVSGFMWIKTMREENEVDHEWIEQEGNVYMARIEEARKNASEK
ncbi:sporulation YhaL family protein [Shouchella patagoniensis]|uniref:sporulation YhaL family protein n=1 Tax=Shouchella patagoniensis TaxID=228576 RepID=UPI001FE4821B|nr:sporulation YhaL family protein [Shouchella patagoniensis]